MTDYYVYDMSEYCGWDFQETGRIGGADDVVNYWGKTGHHAFIIRVGGKLAGFAWIKCLRAKPVPVHDMGEFYIIRKYRRRGVGRQVAFALFARFAGEWQVRQLKDNLPAIQFWRRIINEYTRGAFKESVKKSRVPEIVQTFATQNARND